MGMNTALKNVQILDNACGILGIEFMAAAQALDFREFTPGKGSQAARGRFASRSPTWKSIGRSSRTITP